MRKVIGIDPGKKTGLAICQNNKILELVTTDFCGCIDALDGHQDALVIIEKPHSKHVWHDSATSKKAIQRTGVNVGSALREAELIIEYMIKAGRDYHVVHPKGKINKDQFRMITGWEGKTNTHTRDAGMLAYGVIA